VVGEPALIPAVALTGGSYPLVRFNAEIQRPIGRFGSGRVALLLATLGNGTSELVVVDVEGRVGPVDIVERSPLAAALAPVLRPGLC
jgi:hypothetical protein